MSGIRLYTKEEAMLYFIINPRSQSGQSFALWKRLKGKLDQKEDLEYRFVYTRYPGHMTEIVTRLTSSSTPKHLVILGGDGSFNEAICGLQNPQLHRISFLSVGSGNDLARSLDLPKDFSAQMERIFDASDEKLLDLGVISYRQPIKNVQEKNCGLKNQSENCNLKKLHENSKVKKKVNKQRNFAVSAGIGFDAAICQDINTGKLKKIFNRLHLGRLAYPLIGLRQLLCWKPQYGLLWIDEEKEPIYLERFLFLSAHIHPYEGGGFPFCPDADYQDGYLDLCVVSGLPLWRLFPLIPLAKKGHHVGKKGVLSIRCKKARILLEHPKFVHTDGEIPGRFREMTFASGETGYYFV
jgi:diacylglycerol kinase family enzyme